MKNIDMSIVIVSWNTCALLDHALESVYKNANRLNIEVIVVDNHSSDGSASMVRKKYPHAVLIESKENLGFTRGNNLGFKYCSAPFILFLNSDTLVPPDALYRMVKRMSENPGVGVLGPKLLNSDGSLQISACRFPSFWTTFIHMTYDFPFMEGLQIRKDLGSEYATYSSDMMVDWVSGACLLIRRSVIEAIGGTPWNESLYMYSEDVDLCYRVHKASFKILYYTGAEIVHIGRQSTQQVSEWSLREQYVSQARFRFMHYGFFYGILFLIEVLVLLSLRSVGIAIGGFLKAFRGSSSHENRKRIALNWKIAKLYAKYLVRPSTLWDDMK
jgi:GT2 family glycosyltransferase